MGVTFCSFGDFFALTAFNYDPLSILGYFRKIQTPLLIITPFLTLQTMDFRRKND